MVVSGLTLFIQEGPKGKLLLLLLLLRRYITWSQHSGQTGKADKCGHKPMIAVLDVTRNGVQIGGARSAVKV